jgi:hypothetical protein
MDSKTNLSSTYKPMCWLPFFTALLAEALLYHFIHYHFVPYYTRISGEPHLIRNLIGKAKDYSILMLNDIYQFSNPPAF